MTDGLGHEEIRRRLAEGDVDNTLLDHVNGCPDCQRFAAAFNRVQQWTAATPLLSPAPGAADRAVARFRHELAAGRIGPGLDPTAPAPPAAPAVPAEPPAPSPRTPGVAPPPPPAGVAAPPPAQPTRIVDLAARRRRRRLVLAGGGLVAAAVIAVALVVGLPGHQPPSARAVTLHEVATQTRGEGSARLRITGDVSLRIFGSSSRVETSGAGAARYPDRDRLSIVTRSPVLGQLVRADIISIGDRVYVRQGGGPYRLASRSSRVSIVDKALVAPDQALDRFAKIGSAPKDLGIKRIGGRELRRLRLTIPGDAFHAFGSVPQQVRSWTITVDVGRHDHVLRRLVIDGSGTVNLGASAPFSYHLAVALSDFGAPVKIQPPSTH